VFITDEVKDVVPDFLQLLHGVLDSPDIPLNVSRSYLQADASVKKISQHITKKVADKLQELYKKDRKDFEKKWNDISIFVKYGIVSDEKFYDRAKEFALLKNVDDQYFTFDEYKEKVKTNQTEKDDNFVYLYASDKGKQHAFIEAAKNKGYDVLLFDGVLDSHFINTLEQKLEKVHFKRVDSETADKLIQKDEKAESILSKDDETLVKGVFEKAIGNSNMHVTIEAMAPGDLPVFITMSEFMRRMKDMAKVGGGGGAYGFMGNMPDNYNVAINGNHPIVQKILSADTDEKKNTLAKQAYDLALLSQNMLTGADLTDFIKRSVALVS
jgi:molecular chaperone HtpG